MTTHNNEILSKSVSWSFSWQFPSPLQPPRWIPQHTPEDIPVSPAVEGHRQRQGEGQHPDHQQQDQQGPLGPHPLGQEGPGHGQPAVHAHQADQVDGHVHVGRRHVVHQLARRRAELPAAHGQVAQEKGRAEQHGGVRQRQVQHQQAGHGPLLHPAEHGPRHEQVPGEAQHERHGQDGDADLVADGHGGGGRRAGGGGGGVRVGRHHEGGKKPV